jgi:RHS repeat-associated protein
VRALTSESGTITDTYIYDAFGILVGKTGTSDNAYLYRGEQWDADLGLYYNRARYLSADSGRFWSMDAYEGRRDDPIGLHKYLYCAADPVISVDPSGYMTLMDTQIGQMISGALDRMATVNMRFVYKKTGCWVVKYGIEQGISEGIYVFLDGAGVGGLYTGMSVDIERRLAQHARRVIQPLLSISANVSPQVLRQLEQTVYNIVKEYAADVGKATTNKINPLREELRALLSKAIPLC